MAHEVDYLVMSLSGGVDGNGIVEGVVATPKFLLRAFEVLSRHADAPPNNLDEAYGKPKLLLCDRMAFLPTLAVRFVLQLLTFVNCYVAVERKISGRALSPALTRQICGNRERRQQKERDTLV